MDTPQLKSLLTEWQNCDSITRKDSLKNEIRKLVVPILKKEYEICRAFGEHSFWCDDGYYQADKGWFSLEDYEDDSIRMLYEDRWAYGGECSITLIVPLKDIEDFDEEKLKARLKAKKIKTITREISDLEYKLKEAEAQLLAAKEL